MLVRLYLVFLRCPGSLKIPIFDNDETGEAENPDEFFEQLVLPEGHKDLVKSLIAQHFRDKAFAQLSSDQTDIIRGKGNYSLIMRFHSRILLMHCRARSYSASPWCSGSWENDDGRMHCPIFQQAPTSHHLR